MEKEILAYIKDNFMNGQPEDDLLPADDLLGSGIIDSMGFMRLVMFIETEMGTKIPPEDMTIENFMTVDSITAYLNGR